MIRANTQQSGRWEINLVRSVLFSEETRISIDFLLNNKNRCLWESEHKNLHLFAYWTKGMSSDKFNLSYFKNLIMEIQRHCRNIQNISIDEPPY